MEKYITLTGLQARDVHWKYTVEPEAELKFEPGTVLIVTHPPKLHHGGSVRYIGFRLEGGDREYFTSSSHFKEFTKAAA